MRWKWILGIAVVLIFAFIVVVYVVLSSYDFNQLKPRIAGAVRDATGRELTLGGDIELEIGFTPSLVVKDVSFQNAPWGSRPELIKIRHFEVQVALLPLIRGNIEIKRFIADEPDILIETDKTGKLNLAFQTVKEAVPAEQKEGEPSGDEAKLPPFAFNEVRIKKGRFAYRDGRTGQTYTVTLDRLTAVATGTDSPVDLALRGAYDGKPFELSGKLGPLVALTRSGEAWPLELEAKAGGAVLTVHGAIRDALHAKGLDLKLTAQGRSIPEVAKLADVAGIPDVGPFKVAVEVTDPGGKLTVEKLDVDVGTEDLAKVKLTGAVKDPMTPRGIELDFTARGKDLARLEKLVGQPLPFKGAFAVSGRAVDPAAKIYKISDLKVALGDNVLTGSVEVSLAGKRPLLTATLSSKKLDLRPLLPEEAGTADTARKPSAPAKKRDKVFPDDPLPLDALKHADATVKIRAGRIFLPRLALKDVTVDMVLHEGNLTVKPVEAVIGGGTLDGRFGLRPQGKTAALSAWFEGKRIDLGRMLKELGVTDVIEGSLDIALDIKSRGGSVAALMAGLDGKTVAVMGKGRIENKYIDLLGADISTSVFRLLNPFKQETNYTEINCFVCRFDIEDGLAESTALVFDTSQMSVVGDGEVNLKTEELSVSLKPSPKKGVGTSVVGTVSMGLTELAKPFKLGGTLADPSLAVDTTQTAITLGKAVAGVALFGPVGIAAVLVSGKSGDENPCLAAIEAAESGVEVPGRERPEDKKGVVKKTTEDVTEGVKGAVEGVGEKLKKLFGKE